MSALRSRARPHATVETVLAQLDGVHSSGGGYVARCPAHDDHTASLSIRVGDTGATVLKCHAGCAVEDIVTALGLTMTDLFPPREPTIRQNGHGATIVATYDYRDEDGRLLYQVCRLDPKSFRQRQPDGRGGWRWNLDGVRRVLYRLPELLAAAPFESVALVEGEKDAEHLAALGLAATTNAGGAGKWRPEYSETLRGRNVVILPDNDEPGRQHAGTVASALHGVAASVQVVELPNLPLKGDVSDWLDRGGTVAGLHALTEATPLWSPPDASPSVVTPTARRPVGPAPLGELAYHGLAGEITRAIAPQTEADPAAILVNTLVCFGSAVGRGPHMMIGASRHQANLFAVHVGESSRGRKGTALAEPRRLFADADLTWSTERVQSGLSSGEGLIHTVRDQVIKSEPRKEQGRIVEYIDVVTDPGVTDKRLLAIEQEFAAVLRVAARDGNTLSTQLRLAWDGVRLQTLTRANPLVATDPHISMIGNVTRDELLRYLNSTEAASGFGNRFLWLLTKRSQLLPFGGQVPPEVMTDLSRRLTRALATARTIGQMTWADETRALWAESYPDLTAERAGLFGAVTARAEANTLRLAMVYALVDGERAIRPAHLAAALAVWEFAETSALAIFGDATGDPVADGILTALRTDGEKTREELRDVFSRHVGASRIDQALGILAQSGHVGSRREETGGRPRTIWSAAP